MEKKKILRLLGEDGGTKLIPSKKFPGIKYMPGEDVWVNDLRKSKGEPVSFDLSTELTESAEAIRLAAAALDRLDGLETNAREYMKQIAADPAHSGYEVLRGFFGRRQGGGSDTAESGGEPALDGLIDRLTLERLGGLTDKESRSQVFVMDFSLTRQYGEEILAVYLDSELKPFVITVES